jgi:hypothetical protein
VRSLGSVLMSEDISLFTLKILLRSIHSGITSPVFLDPILYGTSGTELIIA